MKRIFTTLFLTGGLALSASAQSGNQTAGPKAARTPGFDKAKMTAKFHNPSRSSQSAWLNYAYAADSLYGGIATLNANYLYPDSNALGEFGTGTWDYIWIHSLSQTLDPTAYYHNYYTGLSMSDADAYSVDSMGVVYVYDRQSSNPNQVDTLIVKLSHSGTTANFLSSGFIGATAANYGTDTVGFKLQKYDYLSNMAAGSANQQVYKIPLTIADTSVTFFGEKFFQLGFQVPAGKVVGASVTFKPGAVANFGDTADTQLNYMLFASYEEQGANTFPVYNDCNYLNAACDFNVSGIVRTQETYNQAGNSWNGNYIPTWAFTQGYSLEHHLWDWKVSTPPASIKETDLGIGLGQNMPNPANGLTTIKYDLKKGGNVSFEVYDIAGKQVMSMNEGNKAAGSHSIELNVNNLNAGVYFYTLTVDGARVTKKMTITE